MRTSTEGLERDIVRAVSLYERAIEGGSDCNAIYELANVLSDGTWDRDIVQAV